jgi:dihydrofolate reductase
MVMGRHTYEFVSEFGKWYYGDLPVYVLSSRGVESPGKLEKTVSTISGSPTEVAKQLADLGFSHLYVDGGKTIQSFLSEGLIYQMTITQVPILLGSGIPLFGRLPHDIKLDHLKTKSYANGLVQSRYEVMREE